MKVSCCLTLSTSLNSGSYQSIILSKLPTDSKVNLNSRRPKIGEGSWSRSREYDK